MTTEPSDANRKTTGAHDPASYTVLSRKAIVWWAVLIVTAGVGMALWLLLAYGGGDPRVQLDAIRTAGTIVVGTGGGAALLLGARRQRSTEIALKQKDRDQAHQEQVAAATEADAAARRITDLYTKAIEQLGSEKAPVRLGGLYALERLAQDNPNQRQTIVNVLCAYLRMPYVHPGDPPAPDAAEVLVRTHEQRVQERQVRLTAQRLLVDHLRPGFGDVPAETFWPNIDLDLATAILMDFDLSDTIVRQTNFRSTRFTGEALFRLARFQAYADFEAAIFGKDAWFEGATFGDIAHFEAASFGEVAIFRNATFIRGASFRSASFGGDTDFNQAMFNGPASFWFAKFSNLARFRFARFAGVADFRVSTFNNDAYFGPSTFGGDTYFEAATFSNGVPDTVAPFLAQGDEEPGEPAR